MKKKTTKNNHKKIHISSNNFSDEIWICGKHSVFSAISQKRRKISEILTTQNNLEDLLKFLKNHSLNHLQKSVKLVDNKYIESRVGSPQIHQGLAILASKLPVQNQIDLLEELYEIKDSNNLPKLLLLDQVCDPHNVGAIIRSAAAFGIKKVIFCEHNSPKENATIVKSSAGTIDYVDLVVVVNFSNLIEKLKKLDYWCIGLAGEATQTIDKIKDYKNIALIVGSEGDGIRSLVKKNCDLLVKINMNNNVESLNASVATAIALYEMSKN